MIQLFTLFYCFNSSKKLFSYISLKLLIIYKRWIGFEFYRITNLHLLSNSILIGYDIPYDSYPIQSNPKTSGLDWIYQISWIRRIPQLESILIMPEIDMWSYRLTRSGYVDFPSTWLFQGCLNINYQLCLLSASSPLEVNWILL